AITTGSARWVEWLVFWDPPLNRRWYMTGATPIIALLDRAGEEDLKEAVPEPAALAILGNLLTHGADPNYPDAEGWTPLMVAAASGHLSLVETLVSYGAKINQKAKAGTN